MKRLPSLFDLARKTQRPKISRRPLVFENPFFSYGPPVLPPLYDLYAPIDFLTSDVEPQISAYYSAEQNEAISKRNKQEEAIRKQLSGDQAEPNAAQFINTSGNNQVSGVATTEDPTVSIMQQVLNYEQARLNQITDKYERLRYVTEMQNRLDNIRNYLKSLQLVREQEMQISSLRKNPTQASEQVGVQIPHETSFPIIPLPKAAPPTVEDIAEDERLTQDEIKEAFRKAYMERYHEEPDKGIMEEVCKLATPIKRGDFPRYFDSFLQSYNAKNTPQKMVIEISPIMPPVTGTKTTTTTAVNLHPMASAVGSTRLNVNTEKTNQDTAKNVQVAARQQNEENTARLLPPPLVVTQGRVLIEELPGDLQKLILDNYRTSRSGTWIGYYIRNGSSYRPKPPTWLGAENPDLQIRIIRKSGVSETKPKFALMKRTNWHSGFISELRNKLNISAPIATTYIFFS